MHKLNIYNLTLCIGDTTPFFSVFSWALLSEMTANLESAEASFKQWQHVTKQAA